PSPRWQDYLPADDESSSTNLVFLLLQVDIECRIKAGLPALLAERYFEHPRLQQPDAYLNAEHQVDLIRWEYQQRWQNGQRAQRCDYQAAFPEHAEALGGLKPHLPCPCCNEQVTVEETAATLHCPVCAVDSLLAEILTPSAAGAAWPTE